MLNLTRTPLPTYLPTAVNKPVQATPHQRVGSQEQVLESFFKGHTNERMLRDKIDYLRRELPPTFPLLLGQKGSRLDTTLENLGGNLIISSILYPLTRFLRVKGYDTREVLQGKLIGVLGEVQNNPKILELEKNLETEFKGIQLPKVSCEYLVDDSQPENFADPYSEKSFYSSLNSLKITTSLMKERSKSYLQLSEEHLELIALFSKELGVNRKLPQ
jgi:hypothetical protein